MCPALAPAMQAGTLFTYPGGMEGWVDLVDLVAPRPGVEHRPFDHESDAKPLHYQDNLHHQVIGGASGDCDLFFSVRRGSLLLTLMVW